MVKIKKQLINDTPFKYGKNNGKKFITVHETDNWNKGAGAQAHANLQSNGNSRNAAWHWQVDDKVAIQSFDHSFQLWAGGDGKSGDGNNNSIHVEICVNSDSDYVQAVKNAAELVKYIMKVENLKSSNVVVQHNHWSGKNCPRQMRAGNKGVTWKQFKNMIVKSNVASGPTQPSSNGGYSGNSIVDYLESKGIDSSASNRKKLAKKWGVSNYDLSAKKNLELLNKMRSGKKPSKPSSTTSSKNKSSYKGDSIVDYLKSIGVDSSFANRKKLAKKYGIHPYTGTAGQNLELLKKMRGGKVSKPTPKSSFKVGDKVKIKSSAKKYSRSTHSIPSKYKNKSYTIQQVGKDDVLLKELYSWVKKSDVK